MSQAHVKQQKSCQILKPARFDCSLAGISHFGSLYWQVHVVELLTSTVIYYYLTALTLNL